MNQPMGWIPPGQRTDVQQAAHEKIVAAMPKFHIQGKTVYDDKKYCLFDLWKHPSVVSAIGFEWSGIHQFTGSCVGAGGGNTVFSTMAWEVLRLNDPEQIVVPFWLLPYGRSRYYMGDRGPGEGSLGSCFARAIREDGILPAKSAGLPTFNNNDGVCWGGNVEMSWSDGDAQQTMDRLSESRKHPVKTTAELKSADQVRDALVNGYAVSEASMYGFNPRVEGSGAEAVLIGRRGPQWSHQMSFHGWWEHPRFGELFWLQNQWGLNAHGSDPSGGPAGGVWVPKQDVDWICRSDGEVYAFSQFQGFPAQTFKWDI
jgi:hypothetical protein